MPGWIVVESKFDLVLGFGSGSGSGSGCWFLVIYVCCYG